MVLLNGFLGTLMAVYLYNNFVGWLNFLNTMIPSIGGIIIADYFILNGRSYSSLKETDFEKIRPCAVIAWISGVFAAKFIPGIAPVNSILCAVGVYGALELSLKAAKKDEAVQE